jgi:EAL domain-containing protein (putative c-di-GMP-specific phosphodiesterase class I)
MQLLDDSTYQTLNEAIALARVPRKMICIEITEQSYLVEQERTIERLCELRESGIKIALDDFGSGYSSINYLQTLPLDVVKFDRTFLSNISLQGRPEEMLQACHALATACDLGSVVEGVETLEHQKILDAIGFDFYQGYFYSRPLPEDDLIDFLHAARRLPAISSTADRSIAFA